MIEIPLTSHEMKINYTINNGMELNFFVPGRNQNMRWAAYSVSLTPRRAVLSPLSPRVPPSSASWRARAEIEVV